MAKDVYLRSDVKAARPEHGRYLTGAAIDDAAPETVSDAERHREPDAALALIDEAKDVLVDAGD